MIKKIVIATTNRHKVEEIRAIADAAGYTDLQMLSLSDFPAYRPPEETGVTFAENAAIKALTAAEYCGMTALADDSGLTVEALNGAPGVYSARFAADLGMDHHAEANNRKLLSLLADLPMELRQAAFRCVVAIAGPDGTIKYAEGCCTGQISFEQSGIHGFGYDPLFYLPQYQRTMAELTDEEKNQISHRGLAVRLALPLLAEM